MRTLVIPEGYSEREEIETTEIRRVIRHTYRDRWIEAYFGPDGELVGLKHVCVVRIYQSPSCPCYGFYENIDGQTCLELYETFDSGLLLKVLQAHYTGITLEDIVFWPGSKEAISTFSFLEPCVVVQLKDEKKESLGVSIPLGTKLPVDYYHYY